MSKDITPPALLAYTSRLHFLACTSRPAAADVGVHRLACRALAGVASASLQVASWDGRARIRQRTVQVASGGVCHGPVTARGAGRGAGSRGREGPGDAGGPRWSDPSWEPPPR